MNSIQLHNLHDVTSTANPEQSSILDTGRPIPIDLRRAVPPTPAMVHVALSDVLAEMSKYSDLGNLLRLPAATGTERIRAAGAKWLSQRLAYEPEPSRVLLTHGTQNALAILFRHFALLRRGSPIATEALTYTSLRPLVTHLGLKLVGLEVDSEGLIPDAFESLCRLSPPQVLYLNPTLHNPTVAVMSETRRHALATTARLHGVPIIEDDVQGFLDPDLPRPIAAIAPDITWYMGAFGKSINLGLRNTYLVAPSAKLLEAAIAPIAKLTNWGAAALPAEIGTRWIEDGTAQEIVREMAAETAARYGLAARILGQYQLRAHRAAHHGWLRPPEGMRADFLDERLREAGVLVWAGREFAAEGATNIQGVRLSFSNVATHNELEEGLSRVADVLSESVYRG